VANTPPILFNKGRVTSRAAAMLELGEMTIAEDAEYRLGDEGVHSVEGTAAFNSTAESGAIRASGFAEFEGAPDLVVACVGSNMRKAAAGLTGAFSDFTGVGSPGQASVPSNGLTDTFGGSDTLDLLHYANEYAVLNGNDRNRTIEKTGDMKYLGMRANTAAPTVTNTGAGSGFTLGNGNTIDYWVEERVKDANGTIVKRNASLKAQVAKLTGTGGNVKPEVNRPAVVNRETTHWAAYATATNSAYPIGFEIGEVAVGTTKIEDVRTGSNPQAPGGSAYPLVTVSLQGVLEVFPKFGPPPERSDTGDIFEDAAVINDLSDRSIVRFSFFDSLHAWPASNVIKFGTKRADEVQVIRRIGSLLLVLLRDSVWRVLTLPQPTDAAFAPERAKEEAVGQHGCVGSQAADVVDDGLGPVKLAYVTTAGVVITDGGAWDVLSDDIDWEEEVDVSQLSLSILKYNQRKLRLEMSYIAKDGTRKEAFFHLHPSHLKFNAVGRPRAKATWPINRPALSLTPVAIGGVNYMFAGAGDGRLYRLDAGTTNTMPGGAIAFRVRSARMYLAGVGAETTITEGWVHHNAADGVEAVASLHQHSEGSDHVAETLADFSREEATTVYKQALCEAVQVDIRVTNPANRVRLDFATFDIKVPRSEKFE